MGDEDRQEQPGSTAPSVVASIPLSRRAIVVAIVAAVVVLGVLALLARRHASGARRAADRIDRGLELSERILRLARESPADLRGKAVELAEEVTAATKAGVLRDMDLYAIEAVLRETPDTASREVKAHSLERITRIIMDRAAKMP